VRRSEVRKTETEAFFANIFSIHLFS